ncbi:MAG: serine/threonine-protein kinase [Polyangiaceae bacterium]
MDSRKPPIIEHDSVPSSNSSPVRALIGAVLDERYRIERLLGEGGMGWVFLGTHTRIDKQVAIKVLRADLVQDQETTTRFLNEAIAASRIGSPHIVDVSDYGLQNGIAYFVMEHLDGASLASRVSTQGAMPLARVIHIARQIAHGLQAAHDVGIIHRDLKPENVMLVRNQGDSDFVKVFDFGIAKVATAATKLTKAGSVFGTPHYMSPEQAAGAPVDHRADVYSLGVLMYEMACGKAPFDGETMVEVLSAQMFQPPPPLAGRFCEPASSASVGFEAIVMKALAKKSSVRYGSMKELLADLDALEVGAAPVAYRELQSDSERFKALGDHVVGPHSRSVKPTVYNVEVQRNRTLAIGLGIALPALFVGGLGGTLAWRSRAASQADLRAASAVQAAPQVPHLAAPETAAPALREVRISIEPAIAHVERDGATVVSSGGVVVIPLRDGETARLSVSAKGYESKEFVVSKADDDSKLLLTKKDPAAKPSAAPPKVSALACAPGHFDLIGKRCVTYSCMSTPETCR